MSIAAFAVRRPVATRISEFDLRTGSLARSVTQRARSSHCVCGRHDPWRDLEPQRRGIDRARRHHGRIIRCAAACVAVDWRTGTDGHAVLAMRDGHIALTCPEFNRVSITTAHGVAMDSVVIPPLRRVGDGRTALRRLAGNPALPPDRVRVSWPVRVRMCAGATIAVMQLDPPICRGAATRCVSLVPVYEHASCVHMRMPVELNDPVVAMLTDSSVVLLAQLLSREDRPVVRVREFGFRWGGGVSGRRNSGGQTCCE